MRGRGCPYGLRVAPRTLVYGQTNTTEEPQERSRVHTASHLTPNQHTSADGPERGQLTSTRERKPLAQIQSSVWEMKRCRSPCEATTSAHSGSSLLPFFPCPPPWPGVHAALSRSGKRVLLDPSPIAQEKLHLHSALVQVVSIMLRIFAIYIHEE